MTTIDRTPVDADAELARRLERLSSRRRLPSTAGAATQSGVDVSARLQALSSPRRPASAPAKPARAATTGGPRRRRHPARKSRYAALALSVAATAGLAAQFARDDTGSSLPSAQGGLAATASAPTTSSDLAAGTPTVVNGDVFTNRFGPVQVQATFGADGRITAVSAIQFPDGDGRSLRINNRAVPVLNSEALNAQSANVHTVSGATYTSRGYGQSLQSAIDVARAAGVTQTA